ncbi:MAG: hypothetical protein A2836_01755 [Candidatus Taylorbacteria bacterium RIFCSPHIGHO2_01_FULL_45_63]|uniref:Uncharacterized protein n=1 Tax=Candidatus Taylorbacteria bacterium RIFCSPHIGHO2_02_FULL_45_35 TaxID=1802311 RepID=A0A1G2MR25_9BACT|nr:MAG: hypothetical protein A2836_01755 [Candidatus Taylorbacteria bacterium RIFCSPHIGHO2_01_FULL_45_63]OHA26347.1 MAG: hypothetical protein A3D56_03660 [Candidatus Taylorbacteria bacterium RIFCSPHIGHO2_02_FULL_45_35]OHA32792.1 MAG: hypothetical protein A3A22_02515 [Candidatus Taylorbacteria bacterium RIFCSPLOWO2_01_FULL_45_34b]
MRTLSKPTQARKRAPVTTTEASSSDAQVVNTTTDALDHCVSALELYLDTGEANTDGKILLSNTLLTLLRGVRSGESVSKLGVAVDNVFKTITELDEAAADLVAGAEAQAAEFAVMLPKTNVSIEEIEVELRRREEVRVKVSSIQEQLEDRREFLVDEIDKLGQIVQFDIASDEQKKQKKDHENELASLSVTIREMVVGASQNDREVAQLIAYREAIELVHGGLPQGVLGRKID